MKRKIYTADEEMGYEVIYMILFTVLWYSGMVKIIFDKGLSMSVVPFLLAGILPLAQAVNMVRKASCYRNFHKKCMQESCPRQGRIVNIRRKESTEERTGQRGTRRYRRILYYLVVEMINPENGIAMRITSEAYRIPLQKYLASPCVQIYTDSTGWKYVIDGFQLKESKKDPDITLEDSNVYMKTFDQPSALMKGIILIIMGLMIFQMIGGIK